MQFLPFKAEFFAIFIPQGWNLCNFYLEIFFGWKGQKITLVLVNSLKFWFLFQWLGFFLSGILGVCCFDTNHPFSFGWFVEICPEMHALAKMTEMALNRQNRQTINKNSNEMAKGPFGKWRLWRKWRIWRKWQKWRLIAKIAKL